MSFFTDRAWAWSRALWFLSGTAFTVYHVISIGKVDTTAIALLVLTLAVFVLPIIDSIKLPGGVELAVHHEEAKETAQHLSAKEDNLVADISSLLVSFTSSIAATDAILSRKTVGSVATLHAFARVKCADAITDSLRWFAVGESVRVLAYQYDVNPDLGEVLGFVIGNVSDEEDLALADEWFSLGDDDPVGRAWREQRIVNRPEALTNERPLVTDEHDVVYRGIMVVPMRRDDDAWGVLIVERAEPQRFDATAELVGTALSDVIVSALGHASLRLSQKAARRRGQRRAKVS
jgi:GAF domain-containing protein